MNDEIKVPTMQVTPLKKICMTIGELPTSYLETMSYYEMLVWFTNYLRDNIIPVVNNNGEATHELQVLFTELQSYVNNYFDNLDVQDEINNKLDQMLEDGVLEQIIEQFLQLTSLICFDNVASMKASVNLANGSYARTLGYYSLNDGGSALYKVRTITNDDVVDEMMIISLNDNTLIAELIKNPSINIKQLGIKSDKTTDIGTVINSVQSVFNEIFLPKGSYLLSTQITLTNQCNIICDDDAIIYPSITNDLIRIATEFCTYKLNIDGADQQTTDNTKYAIIIGYNGYNARHTNLSFSKIQNLKQSGICWEHGAFANFTNLYEFTLSGYGIYCTGNYNDNNHGIFTNTELIYCDITGLVIGKGASSDYDSRHHIFNNLKFYGCTKGIEIQTNSNMGSVFFEKCSADRTTNNNCGELTSTSKGNKIEIINTVNVWANLIDNGEGNLICGYTNYGFYSFKNIRANSVKIHKENLVGRLEFTQENSNEIIDRITDSTSNTVVKHLKGTANNRTDEFDGKVKIGDYQFSTAKTGQIDISGDISANSYKIYTVGSSQSFASASTIPTVLSTLFLPNGYDNSIDIKLETYMINNVIILKVINNTSSQINIDNGKIRWTCINHY